MHKEGRDQETRNLLIMTGAVEELMRTAGAADGDERMSLYQQASMMAVAQGKTDWFREAITKQETSSDRLTQIVK